MAQIEFYDVKTRSKIKKDESDVSAIEITTKNGQVRYAFRAMTDDGRKLTRFCKQADYEAHKKKHG